MTNENDLIRRADAIEFINSGISLDTDADREYATEMLKNIPPAEAVQGEWIVIEHCSNEYGFRKWIEIECPFCGERPTYENLDSMNFCPNCGARMKGGDSE